MTPQSPGARWKMIAAIATIGIALAAAWYFLLRPRQTPVAREALVIALPMHPTSLLAHVALDQGFFAARGLDVTVLEYPSGKRALDEGLFTGKADITWANETPVALAGLERSDFRILSTTLVADNINKIVARKDRGINKPEDLRGKRIGTQKGSAVHFFLHLFLLEHGLTDKDVQLSFLKAEELPGALASGTVDAISVREPFISQAQALLGRQHAALFEAPGLYEQVDVMVMRQDSLQQKPGVAPKVLQAMLDAEAFVADHPQEAEAIVAKRLGVDAKGMEGALAGFRPHVALSQSLLVLLESEARWAIKAGLTGQTTVPDYLILTDVADLRRLKPEAITIVR